MEPDIKKAHRQTFRCDALFLLVTSGADLAARWQENTKHGGAGCCFHRNGPLCEKVTVKGFSQEKAKGLSGKKRGSQTATTIKDVLLLLFFPPCKSPSKNILTMIKMSDLNSTIMWLRMARAPPPRPLLPFFLLLLLYSLLKSGIEKGEWSTACAMPELCVSLEIRRLPAPSITGTSFLPLPSLSSRFN